MSISKSKQGYHSVNDTNLQVGEFYETIGLDALILMQFCSLNAMGEKPWCQAGAPLGNIDQIHRQLVLEAGFSVVSPIHAPACRV